MIFSIDTPSFPPLIKRTSVSTEINSANFSTLAIHPTPLFCPPKQRYLRIRFNF